MAYSIVKDDIIINVIEADTPEIARAVAGGAEVVEGAGIGWVLTDGEWRPPVPAPVRQALTSVECELLVQQAAGMSDAEVLAAVDDPDLRLFWLRLNRAGAIAYDNPMVAAGLAALVATGHLSEARKDAVLAAWPVQ